MKRFIYLLFFSLLVSISCAQSVRLGSVNMRDVVVVTNEQDTVALNALNATNNILQSKFIERNKGIANNLILSNDTSVVGDIYNKQRSSWLKMNYDPQLVLSLSSIQTYYYPNRITYSIWSGSFWHYYYYRFNPSYSESDSIIRRDYLDSRLPLYETKSNMSNHLSDVKSYNISPHSQLSSIVDSVPLKNSHILYGDITQPSGTSFLFTENGPNLNDIWYRRNIVKNSENAETNSVTYKWSIPAVGSYNFKISSTFGARYTNGMYLTAAIRVLDNRNILVAQSLGSVSYPHARGTLVPNDQYFYELGKFVGTLSTFINGPGTLEYVVTMGGNKTGSGGMESTENYVLFSSPKDTSSAMTLEWSTNALPALVGSDPGPNQVQKLWKGTQEEYDNVPVKSPSTAYLVENNGGPIYRDLEEYNAVPAPYTTTVHLVSSRTTYQVNVDTNMFLSFDASNLDLSGKEAEFKLRLNITETNIPAMQFVGMTFDVEPEILVTGVWEFAISTLDGSKYRARQTWPECCGWQIAASNALPYTAWTGTITPANGTATVTIAHGNMPVLVTAAPCVLTLDPTGYGTAGVSRVSLSYYVGTNSFTFATNIINYAETPTVDTNGWNTLLIRRVSNGEWKGVGL